MPMIGTADVVAKRYKVSREAQDEYALRSQQRTGKAQAEGKFNDEIVPFKTTMQLVDKATGARSYKEVTLTKDECNRADTTLAGPAGAAAGEQHRDDHRRQRQPALGRRVGAS